MPCDHSTTRPGPDGQPIKYVCPCCDQTPATLIVVLKNPGQLDRAMLAALPFRDMEEMPDEWPIIVFVTNTDHIQGDMPYLLKLPDGVYRVTESTHKTIRSYPERGMFHTLQEHRVELVEVNPDDFPEAVPVIDFDEREDACHEEEDSPN